MARLAWITGAGGLIGSHMLRAAPEPWQARGLVRADLDLTDVEKVRACFTRERPELVIHCAAMSKTPECERHPELAWRNNVEVTRTLCELARDVPLLFFSTDLVFDGKKGSYAESDTPNPLNVYARTKVAAEDIVLANPKHIVVRTSLNAGPTTNGSAFNEQLRGTWSRGEVTRVFNDEFRSPLPAEVTARAVWELIAAGARGVWHLGGAEKLTRYAIAEAIAARWPTLSPRLEPSSIRNYDGPRRSPDTSLDSSKTQSVLSFPLPRFTEWLRAHPEVVI